MDKKTWLAIVGLGLSMATNYVQHGSVLAVEQQRDATAHGLSVVAQAIQEGVYCREGS